MSEPHVRRASEDELRTYAQRRMRGGDEAAYRFLADRMGGAFVAVDESTPVAIAIASHGSEEVTIHDLYVEPSFRGQGVGRRLLDAACEGAEERAISAVLPGADSETAAFALAQGLVPQTLLLHAAGAIPQEDDLLRLAAGEYRFIVRDIDGAAHGYALDALDRETRGCERRSDHAYFAAQSSGMAFFLHDEFAGYAYVWPSGRIGPIAAASASYVGAFLAFAMAASVRTYGASWCSLLLPATNARAARTALHAGLRLDGTSAFATDTPAQDFTRYLAFDALLP